MQPRHRRTAQKIVTGLVLAWAAIGAGREVGRTLERQLFAPPERLPPHRWSYATAPVRHLEAFLERAAATLPAGSRLAFASRENRMPRAIVRQRWAAYFLAAFDVVPAYDRRVAWEADYWLAYGTRRDDPRLVEVGRDPDGRVYRVVAP